MKNKTLITVSILSLIFGFSLFVGQIFHPAIAFARDNGSDEIENSDPGNNFRAITTEGDSSATRVENEQDKEDNNANEDINDNSGDNGNERRDQVEEITHKLQEVADEHGDIDDDLNEVIGEMASSSKDTAEAIDDLDNESSIKKFFLGPNFNSLGELRSSIVTTQNHIDRLTKAQEKVTDPVAKATLDAQIVALKDVASSTQEFVDSHERVFSLFGWFVRLFSKE